MPLLALHDPIEEWIMNSFLQGSAHCFLVKTCLYYPAHGQVPALSISVDSALMQLANLAAAKPNVIHNNLS